MSRTMFRICISWLAFALLPTVAVAQAERITVSSPNSALNVVIAVDEERRPYYTVTHKGTSVIAPSRLGFLFTNALRFERNIVVRAKSQRSSDTTWEQPWGERRFVRDRFNELKATLAETSGAKRSIDVVFRVYDDGIGFRYE